MKISSSEQHAAYSPALGMKTRKSTKRAVLPKQDDTIARGRGAQIARRNTRGSCGIRGSRGRGAHFNIMIPLFHLLTRCVLPKIFSTLHQNWNLRNNNWILQSLQPKLRLRNQCMRKWRWN